MAKRVLTCSLLVAIGWVAACGSGVDRDPVPPRVLTLRESFDLGEVVTLEQMQVIHRRLKREGQLLGQGCGVGTDSTGKICGYCESYYRMISPAYDKPQTVTMGFLSGGYPGIQNLTVDGYRYHWADGHYVLQPKSSP